MQVEMRKYGQIRVSTEIRVLAKTLICKPRKGCKGRRVCNHHTKDVGWVKLLGWLFVVVQSLLASKEMSSCFQKKKNTNIFACICMCMRMHFWGRPHECEYVNLWLEALICRLRIGCIRCTFVCIRGGCKYCNVL